MGEQLVVRFHTDSGSEFLNNVMKDMLVKKNVFQTKTMGIDPRANGRAERFVDILKQKATSHLIHSGFPLKFWYWAVKQAARVYRLGEAQYPAP
eukprot:11038377-Lingulodinium_polyedra.AAC.1